MTYGGKYPAIVREYDQASRMCRVEIPGITDGADILPQAEIEYPIGDKSRSGEWETEIEILPGDTVWVMFVGGDPRYPLITGWRNPAVGNSSDWRRWHHKNIEVIADDDVRIVARKKDVTIYAFEQNIKGEAMIMVEFVAGTQARIAAPLIILDGDVQISQGLRVNLGIHANLNIVSAADVQAIDGGVSLVDHRHTGVQTGGGRSGPPG